MESPQPSVQSSLTPTSSQFLQIKKVHVRGAWCPLPLKPEPGLTCTLCQRSIVDPSAPTVASGNLVVHTPCSCVCHTSCLKKFFVRPSVSHEDLSVCPGCKLKWREADSDVFNVWTGEPAIF